jgi:8-oxo-dGTP diphosphatase
MAIGLNAFVAVFLFNEDQVLLLKRSNSRAFAPGKWTGVGGKVESVEFQDLTAAAIRELEEETGLAPQEIQDLKLRVVLTQPESGDLVLVCFFPGRALRRAEGPCAEGRLSWESTSAIDDLEMIENARCALKRILASGLEDDGVDFGICQSGPEGYQGDTFFVQHPHSFS